MVRLNRAASFDETIHSGSADGTLGAFATMRKRVRKKALSPLAAIGLELG